MVKGLEVFARHFAADASHYVLIGGVATQLVLQEAGLEARATKDLDIVLCAEALNPAFGTRLWDFIHQGGYQIRQGSSTGRCLYRFAQPRDSRFPAMLEFFSREPGHLPLAAGAHLTPIPFEQEAPSLSAIFLNADYYAFLHAHTLLLAGIHIVTEKALIPLKARAWLDLSARKTAQPASVDGKHLSKHRNDLLRLAQLLAMDERIPAPPAIATDVLHFTQAVQGEITPQLLHQLGLDESADALLLRLRTCFFENL